MLSRFLNLFSGKTVKIGGFALCWGGIAALAHGHYYGHMAGYSVGAFLALFALVYPRAFNWLSNFADPQFWPAFVGLGVAILFAAHVGGFAGVFAIMGPLTVYDGMYFDQNY